MPQTMPMKWFLISSLTILFMIMLTSTTPMLMVQMKKENKMNKNYKKTKW